MNPLARLRALFASRLAVSALGVGVVFVVTLATLFTIVLGRPVTRAPVEVTVQLRAAGGLFEGSAVTYRGVKIGKVTRMELTNSGVEATVVLTSSDRVPADSIAKVRSLSPVGEQYLDFQPTSAAGPYLTDGSTVAADSTDIPRSLASTVVAINDVLRQIDDRKLRTLLVELSTALRGTGDDIGGLIDDTRALLAELDGAYPETERLVENADRLLDVLPARRSDLATFGTRARSLAAFLRDYDPELETMIAAAPGRIQQLQRLVDDAQRVLPDFLSAGVSLTDMIAAHDPHLRALLQAYAPGLATFQRVIGNGSVRLDLIMDRDPRCRYATSRQDPRDPTRRPLQRDGSCSASFATLQRGAAHAPGPVR